MLAAERHQIGDPGRVIIETREDGPGLNARIELGLRNIHSTNDIYHGNLPCSCDRDPATVRSCVTTAKIPGSPTVVAGGVSGDIAARFGRPSPAKALSRFHRTFCSMCRYKSLPSHILLNVQIQGVPIRGHRPLIRRFAPPSPARGEGSPA